MKKLLWTILLLIAEISICSSAPAANSFQDQGNATEILYSDCRGNRHLERKAVMVMDEMGLGFNMNFSERYSEPWKKLGLNCGKKITRTLNYNILSGRGY